MPRWFARGTGYSICPFNYGIRGSIYNLIKSYLGNILQKVKLNDINSHFQSVNMGVSQATILGPLFLLLYINTTIVSHANDTAIVTTAKTWKEVETKMNETLHKISTWLALNKDSWNTDKTVYIEFWNQVDSTPKNWDINIQGTKSNRVKNTKYLGIIFYGNMRWNEQWNTFTIKLNISFSSSINWQNLWLLAPP